MSKAFDVFQAGAWADLTQHSFQPKPDFKIDGKCFLGQRVGMNGAEVSLNRFPAGAAMPFFHKHKKNEELYIFVGGTGEMVIDEERIPVREGTVVRVSRPAARFWRNTSDQDLYFIIVQYRESDDKVSDIADGEHDPRPLPW